MSEELFRELERASFWHECKKTSWDAVARENKVLGFFLQESARLKDPIYTEIISPKSPKPR